MCPWHGVATSCSLAAFMFAAWSLQIAPTFFLPTLSTASRNKSAYKYSFSNNNKATSDTAWVLLHYKIGNNVMYIIRWLQIKQINPFRCPPVTKSAVWYSSVQSSPRSRCEVLSLKTTTTKKTDRPLMSVHESIMMVMLNWASASRRSFSVRLIRLCSACSRAVLSFVEPEAGIHIKVRQ